MSRDIAVEYEVVTEKASPTGGTVFPTVGAVVPTGVAVFPTGGAGVVLLSRQLDCRAGKGFMIFGIGYV